MRWRAERAGAFAAAALALLLASCATEPVHVSHGGGVWHPPPASPEHPVPDGTPKVGAPYQVAGKWYTPADDRDYDVVGMASWYGPGFHGQYTANGEYYDMNFSTAAHKTLPLPCYVEVTALDTGRRIIVRVNDRGPFVNDRIIDLSHGAAAQLGITRSGLTRVRVRRVYPDDRVRLALRSGLPANAPLSDRAIQYARVQAPPPVLAPPRVPAALPPAAPVPVAVVTASVAPSQAELDRDGAPLAPVAAPAPTAVQVATAPVVVTAQPFIGPAWVQVAALADQGKAAWLAGYLRPIGFARVDAVGGLWRVRLGPFPDEASARTALAKVQAAGYQEAHLVRVAVAG
jgi:rare lipoprotein A